MTTQLVPKRRFKGFEGEWNQSTLGFFTDITMGHSPKSSTYTSNPNDYILVQGNADIKRHKVVPRVWTTSVTQQAEKGDLILTVRAPVGEVAKTEYDVVLGRGVAGIKGNEFLFQYLIYAQYNSYWTRFSTGSTFDSINYEHIQKMRLVFPIENEQQKIGEFFKLLDARIANQKRKIEKIKALKQAYLTEMFPQEDENVPKMRFEQFNQSWEIKQLEDLTIRLNHLRVPVASFKRVTGDIPYFGANGIQDYVKGYTHTGENILIAEDGANDIKDYPIYYVEGEIWVNNHAHVLRAIDCVSDNLFLSYALKTINIRPHLVGGSRCKLNSEFLMQIKTKIPTIEEQQKIGDFFKTLDEKIESEEKKLEKLKKMKEAFLEEMFV